MVKSYQRLIIFVLAVVMLIVAAIMFGLPERNQSEATSALSDNGSEMQIPYYYTPDHLPTQTTPSANYTLLLFSASWDSYSVRLSELLRGELASYNHLQVVELDISDYRTIASEHNTELPPMVILLNKQGGELGRTTSAVSGEVEKLIAQIPSADRL